MKGVTPRPLHGTTLERAHRLRRNQTDAERKMWALLRDRRLCGVKFRRQRPIGSFIVDFCCLERKLIIELDGGQHGEPSQAQADARRSRFLRAGGYRVLRFWDSDALNDPHSVLELIVQALRSETQSPSP
ncbi:MAG: endonuclease domain-containing protein [Candidatus Binataceae bacterium]